MRRDLPQPGRACKGADAHHLRSARRFHGLTEDAARVVRLLGREVLLEAAQCTDLLDEGQIASQVAASDADWGSPVRRSVSA